MLCRKVGYLILARECFLKHTLSLLQMRPPLLQSDHWHFLISFRLFSWFASRLHRWHIHCSSFQPDNVTNVLELWMTSNKANRYYFLIFACSLLASTSYFCSISFTSNIYVTIMRLHRYGKDEHCVLNFPNSCRIKTRTLQKRIFSCLILKTIEIVLNVLIQKHCLQI